MIFELHPPQAAGPLRIGAAGHDTVEILTRLGPPQVFFRTPESRPAWGVHRPSGLFIVAYFDADDRLEAIEFGRPAGKDDTITHDGSTCSPRQRQTSSPNCDSANRPPGRRRTRLHRTQPAPVPVAAGHAATARRPRRPILRKRLHREAWLLRPASRARQTEPRIINPQVLTIAPAGIGRVDLRGGARDGRDADPRPPAWHPHRSGPAPRRSANALPRCPAAHSGQRAAKRARSRNRWGRTADGAHTSRGPARHAA